MLVISRKETEEFFIGGNVTVRVIAIQGDKVRIGIEAPKHVPIVRREVLEREIRERDRNGGRS